MEAGCPLSLKLKPQLDLVAAGRRHSPVEGATVGNGDTVFVLVGSGVPLLGEKEHRNVLLGDLELRSHLGDGTVGLAHRAHTDPERLEGEQKVGGLVIGPDGVRENQEVIPLLLEVGRPNFGTRKLIR